MHILLMDLKLEVVPRKLVWLNSYQCSRPKLYRLKENLDTRSELVPERTVILKEQS